MKEFRKLSCSFDIQQGVAFLVLRKIAMTLFLIIINMYLIKCQVQILVERFKYKKFLALSFYLAVDSYD